MQQLGFERQDVAAIQATALISTVLTSRVAFDDRFAAEFLRGLGEGNEGALRDLILQAGIDPERVNITLSARQICFRLGRWRLCWNLNVGLEE